MSKVQILNLFPNSGYLLRVISVPIENNHDVDVPLDKVESLSDMMAYDQSGTQLVISDTENMILGKGTLVDVYIKRDQMISGTLISIDNDIITLKTKINEQDKIIFIKEYVSIVSHNIYNQISINTLSDTKNLFLITKLNSYSWSPKYSLMVQDDKLINFIFGAEVSGTKFYDDLSLYEIYLHTSSTQERYKVRSHSQRYSMAPSAALMTRETVSSDSLETSKSDLSYKIDYLNDVNINSLNSFQIWQKNVLNNFKQIYTIDIFNRNTDAYRAYVFEDEIFLPEGNVTVLNNKFGIISSGNLSTYLNEKLITVIKEENIQVSVEVSTEITENTSINNESAVYNEQGFNIAGKRDLSQEESSQVNSIPINRSTSPVNSMVKSSSPINSTGKTNSVPKTTINGIPKSVPKATIKNPRIVENTPAPESFKSDSITPSSVTDITDSQLLISNNPYYDRKKIRERIHTDIFSLRIKNLKKETVQIRLSYSYDGVLKRVEPSVSETRPGKLIWNVNLEPNETKIFHGGVKYSDYFNY